MPKIEETIATRDHIMNAFTQHGFTCFVKSKNEFCAVRGSDAFYIRTTHCHKGEFQLNDAPHNVNWVASNYYYSVIDYTDPSTPIYVYPSKLYAVISESRYQSNRLKAMSENNGNYIERPNRNINRLNHFKNNFYITK